MMRRDKLLQQLLKATQIMVQGGLSETSRRCGSPTCICHRDPSRLHGPHLYLTYRVDGKGRSLYVPPEHAPAAREAQQAWSSYWEIGCVLAGLNREQLREQWQEEKQEGKKSSRPRLSHD
jgi:hypothetical protein